MTYTLRILKLPERVQTEPSQTFDTEAAAIAADDYAVIVGGSFVAQITKVVRERPIATGVNR